MWSDVEEDIKVTSGWSDVIEDSSMLPTQKFAARLDGATQSWELSEPILIPENTDFEIVFTLSGTNTSLEGVLEGTDLFLRFLTSADITFFNENAQMGISGTTFALLTLSNGITRDGDIKKITIARQGDVIVSKINDEEFRQDRSSVTGGFTIKDLAKYSTSLFGGLFYEFEVSINGVFTNSIPLTNKAQGATQLANVGSVNAFMFNYTEAVWEEV